MLSCISFCLPMQTFEDKYKCFSHIIIPPLHLIPRSGGLFTRDHLHGCKQLLKSFFLFIKKQSAKLNEKRVPYSQTGARKSHGPSVLVSLRLVHGLDRSPQRPHRPVCESFPRRLSKLGLPCRRPLSWGDTDVVIMLLAAT